MESERLFEEGALIDFNAVIDHTNRRPIDDELFHKFVFDGEPFRYFPHGSDIYDVLKDFKLFPSKNEARRQWQRGPLKEGMNDFQRVGKLRHRVFVLRLPDDFPVHSDE